MRRFVEKLEWVWRHTVVYPLFRLVFDNPRTDEPINIHEISSILVLRYDKIGDMVVTIPILRLLKTKNPNLRIGVVTSPTNVQIARNESCVDECYTLHRNPFALLRELAKARRKKYDVVLNFIFNRTTTGALIANFVAPTGFKVGQGEEKYSFYFNRLLFLPRSRMHMVEILAEYVNRVFDFEIQRDLLKLSITIDPSTRNVVDSFLRGCSLGRRSKWDGQDRWYVVLNISAREAFKRISFSQAEALLHHLTAVGEFATVLISAPEDKAMVRRIIDGINNERCFVFPEQGVASLLEIASLLEGALGVITPDTSIIHFASAVETPILGFFTPLLTNQEWLPYRVPYSAVLAQEGLAVSSIPSETLTRRTDEFLSTIVKKPSTSRTLRR